MPCVSPSSKCVGKTDFVPANPSERAAPSSAPLPSARTPHPKKQNRRVLGAGVYYQSSTLVFRPPLDRSRLMCWAPVPTRMQKKAAAFASSAFLKLRCRPTPAAPLAQCPSLYGCSIGGLIWLLNWGTSVWGDAARTARRMPRLRTPGSRKASALKAAAVPPMPNRKAVCSQRLTAAVRTAAIQIVARRHDTFRLLRVSVIRDRVPVPFAPEKPVPLPSLAL
jgi:hypothetical protein